MGKTIYLDNASTTRVYPQVAKVMNNAMLNEYGNPSSAHSFGEKALESINNVRKEIARELGVKDNEIIFTSGATESNNLILNGICNEKNIGKRILISEIEHASVWEVAMKLREKGYDVVEIPVNDEGKVSLEFIEHNIDSALLVSVMHANNEFGTIQDLKKIGQICKKKGVLFHSDCAQSFGKEKINARDWNLDFISASGHKIGASKGIGFAYIRAGIKLIPELLGGHQELGIRAGTENVPGIVGLGKALELIRKEDFSRMKKIREYFIEELRILGGRINGSIEHRLANNVNVSFSDVDGEDIVLRLSEDGIMCSTRSACSERQGKENRVLSALGDGEDLISGTVRFSLGFDTSKKDIDYVISELKKILKK